MKTLYFEAAGCYILHNDVERKNQNCLYEQRRKKGVH